MKPIFAVIITLFFSTAALAAGYTYEWNEKVAALNAPLRVITIGGQELTLRNVEPPKPKDPPRLGLFVGDKLISKTPVWLNREYFFALVADAGKSQLFINGYPDGGPQDFMLTRDKTASERDNEYNPEPYSADTILTRFKKKIRQRVAHAAIVTVGHRGDNHSSPENTRISYENAIANKTPIVEMDLRLTKDNVLVLLHDPTVDRTTGTKGKRAIVDMTLEEAQQLDAGSWKDSKYKGEKIPKVEDIFVACQGKAVAMLDLKCTGLGQSIAELKQKLNYPADGLILGPWEIEEGIALRKYLPDVPMILLHGKLDDYNDAYFDRLKKIGFTWFSINWQIISQEFIDAAHKHDMKIYLWTVNDPIDVAGGVLANVDGIITDDVPATMKIVSDLTTR